MCTFVYNVHLPTSNEQQWSANKQETSGYLMVACSHVDLKNFILVNKYYVILDIRWRSTSNKCLYCSSNFLFKFPLKFYFCVCVESCASSWYVINMTKRSVRKKTLLYTSSTACLSGTLVQFIFSFFHSFSQERNFRDTIYSRLRSR